MEFPKEEVGFVTLWSWVMYFTLVILTSVKWCVCVCVCVSGSHTSEAAGIANRQPRSL